MLNRVILIGRLTQDPVLRYTQNGGVAVTRFSVAVNRKFTNQSGERDADFINIVTWRGLAENCGKYLRKGSLVGLEGRLQTSKYENQEGRTIYTTDVVADDVRFLDTRNREMNQQSSYAKQQTEYSGGGYGNNYGNNNRDVNRPNDPFADDGKPIDISDDDLPF